ncbi:MAG: DUF763 domain-containing protein [Candidatus Nanohaloarchaea archaeon]|nr:DUF763 domain-containing protein [Candidatus Nanohaloarchaea archaeon]
MPRSGTASLPLHEGRAPKWLFERMEELAGAIAEVIVQDYGREELLRRLSDPYWFQCFGCVLGFDWHSSGLTTTTMGALQEAMSLEEHGVTVLGGKGAASRRTQDELEEREDVLPNIDGLGESSRMVASVDSSCLQDSYELYHHTFVVTESGDWAVVQQGMNTEREEARRYHWLAESMESFMDDPQEAVCCDMEHEALNLSASDSEEVREVSLDLVRDDPDHLKRHLTPGQSSLTAFTGQQHHLEMPRHHWIEESDISERTIDQLRKAYELQPEDFEELVSIRGIGRQSLRALALIAKVVHGAEASWQDPVQYSFAHGGKDGTPYPVDRETYDESIDTMQQMLEAAEVERKEKRKAFRRLRDAMD